MALSSKLLTILVVAFPAAVHAGRSYNLVKEYAGSNFFDDWNFYGKADDLNSGDAFFLSAADAKQQQLAYVESSGNAIIKVDNKTVVPYNEKRNTIRIASKDSYGVGSVWIADMLHVPFGCSVWPSFWSQAPGWPNGGEIDTFEAINKMTRNQFALHTNPGCTVTNPIQTSTIQNSTDCSYLTNGNQGCVVTNPSTKSYGPDFASAGGGVFVTEMAEEGVSIWFFSRADVPQSLQGDGSSLDISTLGTPVANYPSTSCTVDKFFEAQNLIFQITLCGVFANGNNGTIFHETCTGVCYNDWVLGPPSNYDDAYFEIQHVRVYGNSTTNDPSSASGSSSPRKTASTSSSSASPSGSPSSASSLSRPVASVTLGTVICGALYCLSAFL